MRYIKFIFFFIIAMQGFAKTPHWLEDFEQAQAIAKEQNRPLLIAFLGPNWCPYSDELEDEILNDTAFISALGDKLVFLRVDIPDTYEENSADEQLREHFQIASCPTLILVQPNGHEIAQLEYPQSGSTDFVDYINQMLSSYDRVEDLTQHHCIASLDVDELKSLYAQAGKFADSTFKNALLKQGLKVDQSPFFLLQQYGYLIAENGVQNRKSKILRNKIVARDIDNEKGYRRQLALIDFESLANAGHPNKAAAVVKPLISYLQKFGDKDIENAWEIEMKISSYLFSQNQIGEALKHAKTSLKIAPASKREEIAKSVEYLKMVSSKKLS